jgi:hypothetical protein|tara:strand:- start:1917 stop:2081 length:165 start_codon:yes stop_codon:yes gene_type:complete
VTVFQVYTQESFGVGAPGDFGGVGLTAGSDAFASGEGDATGAGGVGAAGAGAVD